MRVEFYPIWIARDKLLNTNNAYTHWGNRSGPAKYLRELGKSHAPLLLPAFGRAKVDAYVSYPDRRKRDVQNLYPTMKSYVDGLVDNEGQGTQSHGKGILPDDNDAYLDGPFLHWTGMRSDRFKEGLFRFDILIREMPDVMPKETKQIPDWDYQNLPTSG